MCFPLFKKLYVATLKAFQNLFLKKREEKTLFESPWSHQKPKGTLFVIGYFTRLILLKIPETRHELTLSRGSGGGSSKKKNLNLLEYCI